MDKFELVSEFKPQGDQPQAIQTLVDGIKTVSYTHLDVYKRQGPNGAGKSTTMNIITGYISYTDGSVNIDGYDILENPIEVKKKIGYLPEIPPLYLDMVVWDYLEFVYELKKIKAEDEKNHIQQVDVYKRQNQFCRK